MGARYPNVPSVAPPSAPPMEPGSTSPWQPPPAAPSAAHTARAMEHHEGHATAHVEVANAPPISQHHGAMVRTRGLLHYVPWIALTCLCLLCAGLGVWIHFTVRAYERTDDGLEVLGVTVQALEDSLSSIVLGTSIPFFVVLAGVVGVTAWRCKVMYAHQRTGVAAASCAVLLAALATVGSLWFIIVVWLVFVLLSDALWAAVLWSVDQTIGNVLEEYERAGSPTVPPNVPSGTCPSQCLDLTQFSDIDDSFADACICDPNQLRKANDMFDDALSYLVPVVVGAFVAWLFGMLLLVNVCCQFSHTKRERYFLRRDPHVDKHGAAAQRTQFYMV